MTVLERAKLMVGNWKKFESFAWFEQPDDADNFCVYHLEHRDSDLLDCSNAKAIREALEEFEEDVVAQHFSHWAVGWIDAVAVRVFDKAGEPTEAFITLCGLFDRLESYPVLDDDDYSEAEFTATMDNIAQQHRFVKDDAPDDWAHRLYEWFSENEPHAIENRDDQGGYPSDEEMIEGLKALGLLHEDYIND